ncbi:hypothetical protein F5Y17DRAFT_475005 [Xylariaceae sp. FL0594]|nr:hypothetical protein F5Y17DRAFT_475005 [Xylariaceae sp. FL0594]
MPFISPPSPTPTPGPSSSSSSVHEWPPAQDDEDGVNDNAGDDYDYDEDDDDGDIDNAYDEGYSYFSHSSTQGQGPGSSSGPGQLPGVALVTPVPTVTQQLTMDSLSFTLGADTCGFTTGTTGGYRGCCATGAAADCSSTIYTSCLDHTVMPNAAMCRPHTSCCPETEAYCLTYAFSAAQYAGSTFMYVQCAQTPGFGELYPYPPDLVTATDGSGGGGSTLSTATPDATSTFSPSTSGSGSRSRSRSSVSAGAIAGAVVGAIALVILASVGVWLIAGRRRRRRRIQEQYKGDIALVGGGRGGRGGGAQEDGGMVDRGGVDLGANIAAHAEKRGGSAGKKNGVAPGSAGGPLRTLSTIREQLTPSPISTKSPGYDTATGITGKSNSVSGKHRGSSYVPAGAGSGSSWASPASSGFGGGAGGGAAEATAAALRPHSFGPNWPLTEGSASPRNPLGSHPVDWDNPNTNRHRPSQRLSLRDVPGTPTSTIFSLGSSTQQQVQQTKVPILGIPSPPLPPGTRLAPPPPPPKSKKSKPKQKDTPSSPNAKGGDGNSAANITGVTTQMKPPRSSFVSVPPIVDRKAVAGSNSTHHGVIDDFINHNRGIANVSALGIRGEVTDERETVQRGRTRERDSDNAVSGLYKGTSPGIKPAGTGIVGAASASDPVSPISATLGEYEDGDGDRDTAPGAGLGMRRHQRPRISLVSPPSVYSFSLGRDGNIVDADRGMDIRDSRRRGSEPSLADLDPDFVSPISRISGSGSAGGGELSSFVGLGATSRAGRVSPLTVSSLGDDDD